MVRIEILQPLAGYGLKVGTTLVQFLPQVLEGRFAATDLFHAAGDFLAQLTETVR